MSIIWANFIPKTSFHLSIATFQQHLHMEFISLKWYDILDLVFPIMIVWIEGCCLQGRFWTKLKPSLRYLYGRQSVFCRSLCVLLSFFIKPCCLSFHLRLIISSFVYHRTFLKTNTWLPQVKVKISDREDMFSSKHPPTNMYCSVRNCCI